MSKKGIFITFEGPEGSGKSTHIRMLAPYLRRRKRHVVTTREPGGTPLSAKFRKILLTTEKELTPLTELFLYEADRAQHIDHVVKPALAKGAIVLCDRHTDSTLAYQGFGRRLNPKMISTLNGIATQGLKPDLTILLDVPVALGLARARSFKNGHDRLERAGLAFHNRVRKGFLTLAKREPKRFRVIPSTELFEAQARIQEIVSRFLKL